MGGSRSYIAITTKVRAMSKNLFTDASYETLRNCRTVGDCLGYLKTTPAYYSILRDFDEQFSHRGAIESRLALSMYNDYAKLYRFATLKQRDFLKMYLMHFEVTFIKKSLRMLFNHERIRLDLEDFTDFFNRHSALNFSQLKESLSMDEFIENLAGTPYYSVLKPLQQEGHSTLFDYEIALDLNYFTRIWKVRKKYLHGTELAIVTKALGIKFDTLNLQWIYRAKKYFHLNSSQIYAMLIPVAYRLSFETLKELTEAETLTDFQKLMYTTYYGNAFRPFTDTGLEELSRQLLHHVYAREGQLNPYSVASLQNYLYRKEQEIVHITTIIEEIRYKVPTTPFRRNSL